jgi:hypothetical protein
MTRDEWKRLHHTIRHETREFRRMHGGWPCLVRHFNHGGLRWQLDRPCSHDKPRGFTQIWTALANQPRALRASRLNDLHTLIAWSREGRTMHKEAARHVIAKLRTA